MFSFIKDAIAEIDHVVWPTQKETKKYFGIVATMIGVATLVLFAFGTSISAGMFAARSFFPHDVVQTPVSDTQTEDVLKKIQKKNATASGSTASGVTQVTASGSTQTASGTIVNLPPVTTASGASTSNK